MIVYYGRIGEETVRFPHYGKYCGVYGYYTRDGFVFSYHENETNMTEMDVLPVEYDKIEEREEEDVFV